MFRATLLTLFPSMFPGPLGQSLAGDALTRGVWSLEALDIREQGLGRHRAVDDTPAGGGPGMVMRADVLAASLDAAAAAGRSAPAADHEPARTNVHAKRRAPMGGGAGPRHPLPALRGRRRARDRGPGADRGVDRRLCAVGRRDRRARRARRLRAPHPRRDGQSRVRARRRVSSPACSNIPTLPARANGRAGRSRTCCCRATTPGSPPGGGRRPSGSPANGGRT